MMHGLVSMISSDVLDQDYIIAHKNIGLNDQMNSKKQEVLKSDRIKEMKSNGGLVFFCFLILHRV